MKRLIILICIAVGLNTWAQNTLSLTGGSGHPGDTVTITLSLTNSDAVTAMQTFIPLGDNLTYVSGSATLTSRSNGHQLTASVLDGSLRLYSYSLSLNSYEGTSGALLTFHVVLGEEPGDVTLMPTSSVLSSATGSSLDVAATSGSVTVLAPKVQVTPTMLDYGHVPIRSSYTRNVTLKNIGNEPLSLVSVGLPGSTIAASTTAATIAAGAQQSITLTYSPMQAGTTTMTAIFHTNATVGDSVVSIAADPYSVNELRPLNVSGYTDSVVTVELRMNNMDSIVGLQTSIKLPSALTYVEGSFAVDTNRGADHIATAGLQGDTLILLVTSLSNSPLHGADGVVARFMLRLHGYGSHTLQLRQTVLSDSTNTNVLSAVYTGSVSIYSPNLNCNNSLDFDNTPVTDTVVAALSLRNTGNAPLVISNIVFTQEHWQLLNQLPITVANNGRDTLWIAFDGLAEGGYSAEMLLYSNDPRNELKRIELTAQRYEPNFLYMSGNSNASAVSPEVHIVLDNYSAVTALQMDVEYPYGYFELEPEDIGLSERANGHIVSAARLNDSTIRLLLFSMQNNPFEGNSGAVATLHLHAYDSLSSVSYPFMLHNVTSACIDGINRLTSIQTTGWFATRIQHDTTYVPDTTLTPVIVYDTTHYDTLVYDFIYRDSIVYSFIERDTTVYNVVSVDSIVYSFIDRDTVLYNIVTVDSVVVNVVERDSVVYNITQVDTTVYRFIQRDTVVYDSTLVPVTVVDTLWLTQHDTIYIHDTVVVGLEGVDATGVRIYPGDGGIVVEGAEGEGVTVFDAAGRRLESVPAAASHPATGGDGRRLVFAVPSQGVYLVRVGAAPARRVVVMR